MALALILKILCIPVGVFSNWYIRGGGWKCHWPRDEDAPKWVPSKAIYTILFGLFAFGITQDWLLSVLACAAIAISMSFSLFYTWIEDALRARDKMLWTFGVFERGLLWMWPLLILAMVFNKPGMALATLSIPILMPLAYSPNWWFDQTKATKWVNAWTVSEMIFGLFWFVMIFLT